MNVHHAPAGFAQRSIVLLLLGVVMAALWSMAREGAWTSAPLLQMEWRVGDHVHQAGRLTETDADIVVLGIDDASLSLESAFPEDVQASRPLQLIEKGWIWPREVYAHVLDRLISAGAEKVVLDLMFATPTPGHPEYDEALRAALERHGDKVVLGADIETRMVRGSPLENLVMPAQELVPQTRPFDARIGFLTYWPDADNVVRQVRAEISLTGEEADRMPSLPANALGASFPAPGLGFHTPRFGSPAAYAPLSLHEVFVPDIWESNYVKPGVFAGKTVFIGPTARHFQDTVMTPVGELYGVQVHAQVCAALKAGALLRECGPAPIRAAIILAALLAALLVVVLKKPLLALVVLIGGGIGALALQQRAFDSWNLILPMLAPVLAWGSTGLFALAWDFVLERRQKDKLRSAITRYFSPDMAEEILRKPGSYFRTLGGVQREITVLFSDLRGFTSLSEKHPPDRLVRQLNQYLERMVEITFQRQGSIDKFIGDAIMAVWGRIRDGADDAALAEDAVNAIATALKMRAGLDELNRQWSAEGSPPLAIGIGIHQGPAIVGNMGCAAKMEFTAIGDSVNLSARLESATKQYGVDLIVSQPVAEKAGGHFRFRSADLVVVKGKKQPVQIHAVLGDLSTPAPAGLGDYEEGVSLFRLGAFDKARLSFEMAAVCGLDDELTRLYLKRCDILIAQPPESWDGVWVLKEK
ncbi:MAG TPA: adenylate/guanylate cyclase domain-containing protein [Prosthecobacter sp.]|nr:adenylate/guanylate cyclase domain-containing protein [Prosthecobacter sp.]HRK15650.1 adenylate/guanylate cyclase domain-containing protein [Prosthecobacter sp.]